MVPEEEASHVIEAMLWGAVAAHSHHKQIMGLGGGSRGEAFAKRSYEQGWNANLNQAFRLARTYFEMAFNARPCLRYLIAQANMDLKLGEYHLAIEVYRRIADRPIPGVGAATETEAIMCRRKLVEAREAYLRSVISTQRSTTLMAETNKTATAMAALQGSDRAPVMAALNKTPVPGDRALRRAMSWRGPQAGIDRGVLPPSTENYDNYNAQVTTPPRPRPMPRDRAEL